MLFGLWSWCLWLTFACGYRRLKSSLFCAPDTLFHGRSKYCPCLEVNRQGFILKLVVYSQLDLVSGRCSCDFLDLFWLQVGSWNWMIARWVAGAWRQQRPLLQADSTVMWWKRSRRHWSELGNYYRSDESFEFNRITMDCSYMIIYVYALLCITFYVVHTRCICPRCCIYAYYKCDFCV